LSKGTIATLGIGVWLLIVGQRTNNFHTPFGQPGRQILHPGKQQDSQVTAVNHMLSSGDTLLNQIAKMGVEFWRSAGDVNGMGIGLVQRPQTGINGGAIHILGSAGWAGINMAMATSHIAELAKVDLQDLELTGPQWVRLMSRQGLAKVALVWELCSDIG
jgi:hypothetical protein